MNALHRGDRGQGPGDREGALRVPAQRKVEGECHVRAESKEPHDSKQPRPHTPAGNAHAQYTYDINANVNLT